MPDPFVFVSYSRSDVDFATRAASTLGDLGVRCWVDVQQLSPGADWGRAIEAALAAGDAVLLLGSRESLASPHCRREWQTAAGVGKPVVVAALEALPDLGDVPAAAVVDMRAAGEGAWPRLADAVGAGSGPHDASVARWRVPRPVQIASVALLVLFAFQAILFVQTLEYVRDRLTSPPAGIVALIAAHLAILAGAIAYTLRWTWRFLHREETMLRLFWMSMVPLLWSVHGIFVGTRLSLAAWAVTPLMFGIVYLGLERGLRAWLPIRRRRRPTLRAENGPGIEPPVGGPTPAPTSVSRYELRCAPQDRRVADRLVRSLAGRGLAAAVPDSGQDGAILILLSNATSPSLVRLDERDEPRTRVCVVLSSIDVPDDLAIFHRYQWVDYRRHDEAELDRLADWLREPTLETARGLVGEPIELSRTVLPTSPLFLSALLTFASGLVLFGTLFPILETAYKHYDGPGGWGLAAGVATAVVAVTTAAVVRARAITFAAFTGLYLATIAFVVVLAASEGADLGAYVDVLVLVGLSFVLNLRGQYGWLLARRLPWWTQETLAPRPVAWVVGRHVALTLAAAAAAAVVYASSDALRSM